MPQDIAPPQALRRFPHWILWRLGERNGKATKIPLASVTDPSQWMEYDAARAVAAANPSLGLGFVFTRDDPFAFIDLDNCGAPGAWNDDATRFAEQLPDAAWEVSQSGRGLHAIVYADAAQLANKRNRFTLPNGTNAEFYTQDRYVALGGGAWSGEPEGDATQALLALIPDRMTPQAPGAAPLAEGPRPGWNGPVDDDALIQRARRAAGSAAAAFGNRATFEQLWTADADALGQFFPGDHDAQPFDHSAADAALMERLAWWTGCDQARMERLFSRSALGAREKWTQRPDYRARTIQAVTEPDARYMGRDKAERAESLEPVRPQASADASPPPHTAPLWTPEHLSHLDKNDHLSMISTVHHDLGYDIRWCEFRRSITIDGAKMTDALAVSIWLDANTRAMVNYAKEKFADALLYLATRRPHHPVREYLATRQPAWDGTPRLDTWLIDYAGAPDTPYSRAVGAAALIGAARRVRSPGCKHDDMIVFEGMQGTGKSTLVETLCPDPSWFTDSITLDMDIQKIMENTAGKWIVEAPELSKLRGAEVEHVKAMLSRKIDVARLAWGKFTSECPRQFIMMGSTNSTQYLLDEENRRFLPIATGALDVDGLAAARDQIWSEAAHREALGESNQLPREVWAEAREQQELRKYDNPFAGKLGEALRDKSGAVAMNDLCEVLGLRVKERRAAARDITGAMKAMGWTFDRATRDFIKGSSARRLIVRGGVVMDDAPNVKAVSP
jgi:shikimate kinase